MPDPAPGGPATCPRCGLALEPRQRFCDGCGLELVYPPDPAPPAEPPAPPEAGTPAATGATLPLPGPAPADAPLAPKRKRTRKAAAVSDPASPPEAGTRFLPDAPPPVPGSPGPAVTRPLDAVPTPAPTPRRPRRSRRAAGSTSAPATTEAPAPHILPHRARGPARRGCLPLPAVIILLGLAILVFSRAGRDLFGPQPLPTLPPTPTGLPRFQVVPPTRAPRRPTPTPEGAVANFDIVASTSYRDRAGTLCLVGVIGNDRDQGRGVEVTARLVDAAGTTLAEARSRYYPSGLLPAGARLPFRLELAQPPPAWHDIRWEPHAFDAPGEAETVYRGLQALDPMLRPPSGPAAPWTLAGQIANTGARPARPLRLYAAVYDAAGALLDTTEADGPSDPLAPGAQTPYTIPLPRPDMQPTRAEVVVEGH